MAKSSLATIKYAATVHRGQLCRGRLHDRLMPSLPTVLETVPIPRPMYWIRRAGPNDLVVTVPLAPPTNGNRPWSLLSGPIRYSHPDIAAMCKRLESAEEDVDEDDARTIVEAWDAVEVRLAKEKVVAYMNDTFDLGMVSRSDSGHASTESFSPPHSHGTIGPILPAPTPAPMIRSPTAKPAILGRDTRRHTRPARQATRQQGRHSRGHCRFVVGLARQLHHRH